MGAPAPPVGPLLSPVSFPSLDALAREFFAEAVRHLGDARVLHQAKRYPGAVTASMKAVELAVAQHTGCSPRIRRCIPQWERGNCGCQSHSDKATGIVFPMSEMTGPPAEAKGEKPHYGLEVSGTTMEDLEGRHRAKIRQLRENPYGVDGYVVIVGFATREVIFSFDRFQEAGQ